MIGLAGLLFLILPNFDVVLGTMMLSSVCTVPSLIGLFASVPSTEAEAETRTLTEKFRTGSSTSRKSFSGGGGSSSSNQNPKSSSLKSRFLGLTNRRFFAFFIAALQLLSLAAWAIVDILDLTKSISGRYYLVPVALLLVSFEWWENYVVPGQMRGTLGRFLDTVRQDLNTKNARYYIGLFLYPWKMVLLLLLAVVHEWAVYGWPVARLLFTHFQEAFQKTDFRFTVDGYDETALPSMAPFVGLSRTLDQGVHYLTGTDPLVPLYFALTHIAASYACFWLVKYACQIWIQSKPIQSLNPFSIF